MTSELLLNLCDAIEATALSQAIQNIKWIVPVVQTMHILAIAAVLANALMIHLRCLGIHQADQVLSQVVRHHRRVLPWGLLALLLSGCVLIIGEPVRSLANDFFQLKMVLLLAVLGLTYAMWQPMKARADFWDQHQVWLRFLSVLALMLWVGIVFSGRWIAYL